MEPKIGAQLCICLWLELAPKVKLSYIDNVKMCEDLRTVSILLDIKTYFTRSPIPLTHNQMPCDQDVIGTSECAWVGPFSTTHEVS